MTTPPDRCPSALSPAQEQVLAEMVSESFGSGLSYADFLDRLHLLCEDIAGLDAGSLPGDMVHRIWSSYKSVGRYETCVVFDARSLFKEKLLRAGTIQF